MRIDVLALDGVLDSALAVTLDVLSAANRIAVEGGAAPPFRVRVVGVRRQIRTGTGRGFRVDARPVARPRPDALVVLGMNVPSPPEVEAALARRDIAAALTHIRACAARDVPLLASCSGTFVCAEAGVLDGHEATTSWWLAPYFRARYPAVRLRDDAMVVRSGSVVTAGAALSQIDLMLWLVRTVAGPTVADLVARYLVIDERPTQARYLLVDHLQHRSTEVSRAEAYARKRLAFPIAVADLARAAGTSPRTLERRFQAALGLSPHAFLQRLRVEKATHLLQTTSLGIEEVAARVGYDDATSLRRIVRKVTGASPRALRQAAVRSR